jgi:AcrR family transcriptional regulator
MLSDKQLQAITMLVGGMRFNDIAEALGVSRTQFWRWRGDVEFNARLDQERAAVHELRADMLWALHERSMDVLGELLDEGDPKTALEIFRIGAAGLTDIRHETQGTAPPLAATGSLSESVVTLPESGFICEDCGKVCKSPAGRKRHRLTHAQASADSAPSTAGHDAGIRQQSGAKELGPHGKADSASA